MGEEKSPLDHYHRIIEAGALTMHEIEEIAGNVWPSSEAGWNDEWSISIRHT